ncbi:MAG: hypothetical protein IJP76_04690 [Paludibacteraceae bacterium]|nr:hypothetical protein [Paludibacteraceae bacterium]
MKTLRYLLSMIAVVSVLSLSAQTPNYGKSYKPENKYARATAQTDVQLPAATMGSMDAEYMHSGSNLPMAAESGVTTTLDEQASERPNLSRPRKERPGDWEHPYDDPLGDVMIPLALCALAYAFGKWIAKRTKPLR